MIRLLSLLCLLAFPVQAEEIVLGLSRDEVDITATFDGSDILVFGAIKRDAPLPEGEASIIITIAGPDEEVTVRRKERRFGIWINTEAASIDAAPSFYAVATSGPMSEILSASEDLRQRITIPQVIRAVDTSVSDSQNFTTALVRIRAGDDRYQMLENAVQLSNDTLFQADVKLPANLTEGDYVTRIFLMRDGRVVDKYETAIPVQKVGLERWLYNLAHEQAFLYGLMSLAIAIAAGWLASAVFSLFRR